VNQKRAPAFIPVKTRRVFEEICDQIRHQLAAGVLKPGDKLPSERELAESLMASRTAVREALRSLEIAGIVALQRGSQGGAFILEGNATTVTQSMRDLLDLGRLSFASLTEARVLIQDSVIRLACQRASLEDFEALEKNILRTEELTQAGRLKERADCAMEFYQLLATAARNEVLSIIVEAFSEIVRTFLVRAGPSPHTDLLLSRRRLLKHLKSRDEDKAVKEMTRYLEGLHEHLIQFVQIDKDERTKATAQSAPSHKSA
jgi:GntR family transcriptional regulator, transcriptional repressor for pyruvate dehydrogenase complex